MQNSTNCNLLPKHITKEEREKVKPGWVRDKDKAYELAQIHEAARNKALHNAKDLRPLIASIASFIRTLGVENFATAFENHSAYRIYCDIQDAGEEATAPLYAAIALQDAFNAKDMGTSLEAFNLYEQTMTKPEIGINEIGIFTEC